jgi:hypothetical protein
MFSLNGAFPVIIFNAGCAGSSMFCTRKAWFSNQGTAGRTAPKREFSRGPSVDGTTWCSSWCMAAVVEQVKGFAI